MSRPRILKRLGKFSRAQQRNNIPISEQQEELERRLSADAEVLRSQVADIDTEDLMSRISADIDALEKDD